MNAYRHIAGLLVAITVACSAYAQSYYDDDIYYNADKAKKEKAEKAKTTAQKKAKTSADSYVTPLPGSDSYTVYTDNNRDVDEYNRRYSNSIAADTTKANGNYDSEDFACTKQIERFYNDQIVSGSGDENLIEYYSDSQLRTDPISYNITVVNATDFWAPYYWSVYRPYGWYSSWGFSYYDPWAAGWYGGCLAWDYNYYYGFGHWHNYFYPYYPSYYPYHHPGHFYGDYGYQRPSYGGMMTHRGNTNNRYSGSRYSGSNDRNNSGRYSGSSYGNRNSGYNTGGAVRDNRRSYNNDNNSGSYNNNRNNSGYNSGFNSGNNRGSSSYNRGGSSSFGGSSYNRGGSGSYGGGGGMRGTGGRRR